LELDQHRYGLPTFDHGVQIRADEVASVEPWMTHGSIVDPPCASSTNDH